MSIQGALTFIFVIVIVMWAILVVYLGLKKDNTGWLKRAFLISFIAFVFLLIILIALQSTNPGPYGNILTGLFCVGSFIFSQIILIIIARKYGEYRNKFLDYLLKKSTSKTEKK